MRMRKWLVAAALALLVCAPAAPAFAEAPSGVQHERTWRPTKTTNGWFPKLSPSGRYVAYGFWATHVADLATGAETEVKAPNGSRMNPAGWVDDSTLIAHTEAPANVYRISVPAFTLVALDGDGAANWSAAADGHWAMSLANRNHIIRDGAPFRTDIPQYGMVAMAGDYTVVARRDTWTVMQFRGNELVRELPSDNRWSVSAAGDVATGYFGRVNLYPAGAGHVDATLSPIGREGVPALLRVNGDLWIWSAIEDDGEGAAAAVIGRRLGETKPIVLRGFPSVETVAVWNGSEFVIAGNNTDGSMQVRHVSINAPRSELRTTPPPPPPPPAKELCGDKIDNNGNGAIDEGCPVVEEPVQHPRLPVAVCDTLKAERAKFPAITSDTQLTEILNRTAYAHREEGFGLSTKTGGHNCPSPGAETGTRIACDILHRRTDNMIWDVLVDAGVGSPSGPTCGEALGPMGDSSRPWVQASKPGGTVEEKHAYDGGDNDTGTCDRCGQVRGAAIHTQTPPPAEICGNGKDDNGNGAIDEGCTVEPPPSGAVLEAIARLEEQHQSMQAQLNGILAAIAAIPSQQLPPDVGEKIAELTAAVKAERTVTFKLFGQNVTAVINSIK